MIYEIVCNITNEKYYGSTSMKESRRLYSHKCNSNKTTSKQIIDRGNYTFNIVERLESPTKQELLLKEKEYIKNNECINKCSPIRTEEELKEYTVQYKQEYYTKHQEDLKKYCREWYYSNKDKVLELRKKRYETNKEQISEVRKQKLICDCGDEYTIQNKSRHCKAKKHIAYIESIE